MVTQGTSLSWLVGVLVFAGATASPARGLAQDRYQAQVRLALEATRLNVENRGFDLTHDYYIGWLRNGAVESFDITLQEGRQYVIVSYCDEDCRDIDLALRDWNGVLVADDAETDAWPVITEVPRHTGRYTVDVDMYSCRTSICYFGIGVFGTR